MNKARRRRLKRRHRQARREVSVNASFARKVGELYFAAYKTAVRALDYGTTPVIPAAFEYVTWSCTLPITDPQIVAIEQLNERVKAQRELAAANGNASAQRMLEETAAWEATGQPVPSLKAMAEAYEAAGSPHGTLEGAWEKRWPELAPVAPPDRLTADDLERPFPGLDFSKSPPITSDK
jgi:hypothetical protein